MTLVHFSDYHSNALPFTVDGQKNSAGIARTIDYLIHAKQKHKALIFNGGDMLNKGSPAWSDKYTCTEWSWFNGLVDAMAFGNHEADYGPEVFNACTKTIDYPVISSNILDENGEALFRHDGKSYLIFESNKIKLGVFALAGSDFPNLLKPETMPEKDIQFANRIETATKVVKQLREQEKVNAVILIGHAHYEDDIELAQKVPGIDIIFGSHSHIKKELMLIPNSNTWYLAPFQYLTYISQIKLMFEKGKLAEVSGGLVKMTSELPEDEKIAKRVKQMQKQLTTDPEFAHLFKVIGESKIRLTTSKDFNNESLLGNLVTDIVRNASKSNLAIFTTSGFRKSLPKGTILEQDLKNALPYKNSVLVYKMSGAKIRQLLNYSISRTGSDFFSQISGVRFEIANNEATNITIVDENGNYQPMDATLIYKVATSNFQGLYADGYKQLFANTLYDNTRLDVWQLIRDYLKDNSPVSAELDGRIKRLN